MKSDNKIFSLIMALFCAISMSAREVIIDEVLLTNGTKLRGLITEQDIKGKSITVLSYESEFVVPNSLLLQPQNYRVNVKKLSTKWQKWTAEHPEFILPNDEIALSKFPGLSSAIIDFNVSGSIDSTMVLVHDTISTLIDFKVHKVEVRLSKVAAMNKVSKTSSSNKYLEVVTLRSGKAYKGRILTQIPGRNLVLLSENGTVTLNFKDISSISMECVASASSIVDVVDYEETVVTTNCEEYTGVIVTKNFGEGNKPAYIEVMCSDNLSRYTFFNKDVVKVAKQLKNTASPRKQRTSVTHNTYESDNEVDETTEVKKQDQEIETPDEILQGNVYQQEEPETTGNGILVNGKKCAVAEVDIKSSKMVIPMLPENTVKLKYDELSEGLKIANANGVLLRLGDELSNEYKIRNDVVTDNAIMPDNNSDDSNTEHVYQVAQGVYAFLMGDQCFVIVIE